MKFVLRVVGVVVLAGVLILGLLTALSWAPDRSVAQLRERWAPPPSVFVDVDGMQVHLRDEGPRDDPEPIVLLHGTSSSLHTWQGWADALKGRHRVIRFDLPGFGLTGPSPTHDYHIAAYEKFVIAMLDRLGVRRCVLGGNSLGGEIAWETAVAYPQRVSRLILVDAGGYPMDSASMPIGFRIAQLSWTKPLMEVTLPRRMVEASVRDVYGDPSKVTPALVDRYYELTLRQGNREALVERFQQSHPGHDAALIRNITQPTLILWGRKDHLIPLDSARRFAHDIAHNHLVVFDGLGHVPQEEDPVDTVNAVEQFLGDTANAVAQPASGAASAS